jgi:predicted RNA-binding protein with PUA-like domain
MGWWLLKTEPGEYGFADLQQEGRGVWDGVRNAQAQGNLRAMTVGDEAFVYHTGKERSVVGVARVARAAYPEPEAPGFSAVDVVPVGRLARPVPLAELKTEAAFAESPLVRQGRLSVVPLTESQWERVVALGGGLARGS